MPKFCHDTGEAGGMREIMLNAEKGKVYHNVMRATERGLIEEALKMSFGNRSIASKILGLNRNTLRTKMKKLDLDPERFRI